MLQMYWKAALVSLLVASLPPIAAAQDVSSLAVPADAVLSPNLARARGPVQVVVRFADLPVAAVAGRDARRVGSVLSPDQQRGHAEGLSRKHAEFERSARALGGETLARMRVALNAIVLSIDAARLREIAAMPGVASIRPVNDYELDLSETVPYIGAAAVQAAGIDGRGVQVAVLDSGIDYTHWYLGGSGVVADFTGNDPIVIEPGTFPTAKVVRGYDFVGEDWPNAALAPDPDPLDKGTGSGHGTHVSDIIAGKSKDGLHKGVAPGASLWAVKVCSSVSTSCSGVAMLQGVEYALDPEGKGHCGHAADVMNLSLGSAYGQKEDDLSAALANAVHLGVVVVVSAGNNGDKPYVLGSPSSTPEVISVAQTQVPSAKLYKIAAGTTVAGGSWQAWSAAPAYVSGPLQYGNGASGNLDGCAAFAAGSLSGKVVLVDRGVCAISIKVSNVAGGGGLAAVVANNASQAPGDLPPDFSFGGGTPTVAGYTITRAEGTLLKTVLGQTTVIDPATAASLVKNMVSSSSRGPSYSFNAIKPDVGAPGASVSALNGTGTGEAAFGGTSGAAPMVSGAAALLLQKYPHRSPTEVKALLMNTADTGIGINPVALPGVLAPITRIGGGEVRVDRALASTTAAWADDHARAASLSFGYQALNEREEFSKEVVVRNYSDKRRTYTIKPSFRYADDAASGAVTISAPKTITVPARSDRSFEVEIRVDAKKLPVWTLNGGARGGDGYRLQDVEFDGYVDIADSKDAVHVAWQVLPHRAADVKASRQKIVLSGGTKTLDLTNHEGAVDGRVDVFSLTGLSPRIPAAQLPRPGDNFAVIDLKAVGVRLVELGGGAMGVQFGINTNGVRSHPAYPAEFDVYIDANNDGTADYVIYSLENGGFAVTGQTVVRVCNLTTSACGIYFYADADLDSGNMILTAPLSTVGLTPGTQFTFSVLAFDNYFTGNLTDAISDMKYTLDKPRYAPSNFVPVVPVGGSTALGISSVPGGAAASPSQSGLLLLYRDAKKGHEADTIAVSP